MAHHRARSPSFSVARWLVAYHKLYVVSSLLRPNRFPSSAPPSPVPFPALLSSSPCPRESRLTSLNSQLTYPLDVLRRRMQVAGLRSLGYGYNSTWQAVTQLVRTEGLRGLYKGIIPNLLKVGPSIGTSFA